MNWGTEAVWDGTGKEWLKQSQTSQLSTAPAQRAAGEQPRVCGAALGAGGGGSSGQHPAGGCGGCGQHWLCAEVILQQMARAEIFLLLCTSVFPASSALRAEA